MNGKQSFVAGSLFFRAALMSSFDEKVLYKAAILL